MMHLLDELQSVLGDSYTFERELAGGGMARVFVAQETRLGRRAAVKVLPADIAGAIKTERFTSEVHLLKAIGAAKPTASGTLTRDGLAIAAQDPRSSMCSPR